MHLNRSVLELLEDSLKGLDCNSDLYDLLSPLPFGEQAVYEHYYRCRKEGTCPRLAEMFALAQPPQSQTDVEFLRGADRQFSEGPLANRMGDFYREVAESQGQCTKGKVYKSGLALYPGDPRAWVADRHEVQKVVEERNWTSTGDVQHKSDNSRESA